MVPIWALPLAMPLMSQVTPVLLVPATEMPTRRVLLTRTLVPPLVCRVRTTWPGPTTSETMPEFAEPGSGLMTMSGKVPGLGAAIEAASSVLETNVVGTATPFQTICAP
jgi:hypothetical protein